MLDYIGEYEGTKERISKAFKIKEHFLVRNLMYLSGYVDTVWLCVVVYNY